MDDVINDSWVGNDNMHACASDSRSRGSGRIQCACQCHRSSRKKTATSGVRKKRSHYGRNPWNFQFNPTTWLTSAWRSYVISQLLTSLWSGGDNSMPGKQLNPQHPAPHQQHRKKNLEHLSPDRMKKDMEELIPVWSKHPKELSFPTHYKSWGRQLQFCNRTIQLQE